MDVMDEALALLGDAGPEYGPGFSNHAPMAAEALLAMGRGDTVIPWVTLKSVSRVAGSVNRGFRIRAFGFGIEENKSIWKSRIPNPFRLDRLNRPNRRNRRFLRRYT